MSGADLRNRGIKLEEDIWVVQHRETAMDLAAPAVGRDRNGLACIDAGSDLRMHRAVGAQDARLFVDQRDAVAGAARARIS